MYMCIVCICIFTISSARTGFDTRSIFKFSRFVCQSFPFPRLVAIPWLKSPVSPNLPIARGRIIRFIPFPRILVLCEKQTALSRFWTRAAMSIYYDNNHCTTVHPLWVCVCVNECICVCVYLCVCVGWLVGWHINLCMFFNAKSIFMQIVSSISNSSV